jgi:hypothetical protein
MKLKEETVVMATEHFDAWCNNVKKFEIGKVGQPFALSSDLKLRLEKHVTYA